MAALELAPEPEIDRSCFERWQLGLPRRSRFRRGTLDAGRAAGVAGLCHGVSSRCSVGAGNRCLCMARKNGKSALCSVLALGYLCGPLNVAGWRGAVASLSVLKANELRRQCEEIAVASRLDGLCRFVRSAATGQDRRAVAARFWMFSQRIGTPARRQVSI